MRHLGRNMGDYWIWWNGLICSCQYPHDGTFFSREQYPGLAFLHGILLDLFDVLIIFRTGNEVFSECWRNTCKHTDWEFGFWCSWFWHSCKCSLGISSRHRLSLRHSGFLYKQSSTPGTDIFHLSGLLHRNKHAVLCCFLDKVLSFS